MNGQLNSFYVMFIINKVMMNDHTTNHGKSLFIRNKYIINRNHRQYLLYH